MKLDSPLRIPLFASFLIHALMVCLLFYIPHKVAKRIEPFVARLVTSEEIQTWKDNDSGMIKEMPRIPKGLRLGKTLQREKSLKAPEKISKPEGKKEDLSSLKNLRPSSEELQGTENLTEGHSNNAGAPSQPSSEPVAPELLKQTRPLPILPRRGLFDKEIVENLAKKESREVPPERGITFDTKELRYYSYMLRLKQKIESIWIYPSDAAQKGIYGDLYIRFSIKKNGSLGNVELVRTSGYRSLDDAAIRALKDASPYWPLPDEWGKDELVITGHFIYSLYGQFIR